MIFYKYYDSITRILGKKIIIEDSYIENIKKKSIQFDIKSSVKIHLHKLLALVTALGTQDIIIINSTPAFMIVGSKFQAKIICKNVKF